MRVTLALVLPMFSAALAAQQFSISSPNFLLQHDAASNTVRNSVALPAGYFGVAHLVTPSAVFVSAYTVVENSYDAALLSYDPDSLSLRVQAPFPLPGNQYPTSLHSGADGTLALVVASDTTQPSSFLVLRVDAATGKLLSVTTADPQRLHLPSSLPLARSLPLSEDQPAPGLPLATQTEAGLQPPLAASFCVPATDPTPADCETLLVEDQVTPGALGTRTPLILIHDAWVTSSLSSPDRAYWSSLLGAFAATPEFVTRYKVFRFHYVTGQRNTWDLARSLRNHLDALIFAQPEYDTRFTLIGHGLGGLLARSYMDHHWHWSGSASSQWRARRAGERVIAAITLATPHHGTPLFSSSTLAAQSATASFWAAKGCVNCANLTDFAEGLPAISPAFDSKVFAYWGYIGVTSSVAALSRASQADLAAAGSIEASGIALERILLGSPSDAAAVLSLSNDGYVPASSAALDRGSPGKRVACPGYDHTRMLYGASGLCSTGLPLLNSLLADLGAPAGPVTPAVPPAATPYTPPPGCSYTLSPAAANHGFTASTGIVTVSAAGGCTWQVQSHTPWIAITATSANSFTYLVETNPGVSPRFGLILVAGKPFYIAQDAVTGACAYEVVPNFRSYSSSTFFDPLTVLSPSTCSWTPTADSPWLTVSPNTGQTGTKAVSAGGPANASGQPRFGAIRITPASGAPLVAQVTHEATSTSCAYSLSSASATVAAGGGAGVFAVQTTGSCPWSVIVPDSWITLSSNASGTGTANISFNVAANTSGGRRFGALTVVAGNAVLSYGVAQDAANPPAPDIHLPSTTVSFGNSLADRTTYQVVAVQNTGQGTLYPAGITQLSGSLGFRVETPLNPVPPGRSTYFVMSYTPGGQVAQSATFRLTSNDPDESTLDLALNGTGIGAAAGNNLLVAPQSISLGEVYTGVVAEVPITIQNRDVVPLNLTYNWTQNGDFRVLNAPARLAVNAAVTLRLRLLPATTGAKSATFRITSSGTGAPSYDVAVSATAISPPAATIQSVRTIPLSGSGTPSRLTVHSGRAYISRINPAGLTIVDLATGTPTANIPITAYSTAFAGQPAAAGTRAFVPLSNLGSNGQVAVFDLNTNALTQYFPAGTDPQGAVVAGNLLWISNANCPSSSGLSLIRGFDPATLTQQSSQLSGGRVAAWLAADSDTQRVVSANTGCGSPDPGAGVSLLDLNSQAVVQYRNLRPSPSAVAVARGKAYINTGQTVEVVDLSSFLTVASIPIPENSLGIAATANHVFTAAAGVVTVIGTADFRVIGAIAVPGVLALAADTASGTVYAVTPSAMVGLQVQQPSFDFSCARQSLLGPSATCSVAPIDGFSSSVSLTCSAIPGASCSWSPSTLTPPATATLTITSTSLAAGHYPVTVQASGAGQSRSLTLSLTSPSCSFTVAPATQSFSGSGGASSVDVQSPTGCSWSAVSNASWLTVTSGSSYSGNGAVAFSAAPNPGSTPRSGTLTVAGQTVTVDQQAAECSYTLNPPSTTLASAGGSASVALTTSLSSCAWTAVSNNPSWLTITSAASGNGSATVTFSATANSSTTSRQGTLTIGGVTFTVSQSGSACSFTASPASASYSAAAHTGSVSLTASSGSCPWTVASGAPWLSVTSATSGTGSATVSYSVAANPALTARSGALTIADQTVTISQDAATCAFSLSPTSAALNSLANTGAVSVTATPAGCSWSATSNADWISILSGASGAGNGSVSYSVPPNPDAVSRSGALTIAGQVFSITQAGAACSFTLLPTTSAPPAAGGTLTVSVQASHPTCAWSAVSNTPWLAISPPASGTGSGTLTYVVAANPDLTERTGLLTVAGSEFRVAQAAGACQFTVNPLSAAFDAGAHSSTAAITASHSSCSWTATSPASWVTIASGGTGTGNVAFQVAANTTSQSRTANLTVAGATVRIDQEAPSCSFGLSSESASVGAAGGALSVNVTATGNCSWTAVSGVPWMVVTSGAAGAGAGSVGFSVASNSTLVSRSGALTIAGKSFTVQQAGLVCSISLSPSSASASSAAGSGSVSIAASHAECPWTAVSSQPWLTLTSPASGAGSTVLTFSHTANTEPAARQAAISVSGQSFELTQAAALCTYTLSPAGSQNVPATAGASSISVSASSSACSWSASSPASWVTITSGSSRTGSGPVGYSFTANPTSNPRSATLTVAGLPFQVVQAGSCSLTLQPPSVNVANTEGDYSVGVTASSSDCSWTAAPSDSWVVVTSGGSGTGNGSVAYRVAANSGPAARTTTISIGDKLHSLTQAAASCSFSLSSPGASFASPAATGSFPLSASNSSCAWTATASAPWITLTSPASGSGSATISFSLAANPDTAQRVGSITVAGQQFAITQGGATCTFSLLPSSQSFGAAAGTGSVAITAGASGCSWTAASNAPWITLTSPTSGSGSGSVSYSVTANAGLEARSGTISVAGHTFQVTQAGTSCAYSIQPGSGSYAAAGASAAVTVSASPEGCAWTASTTTPWITLNSGTSGTGSGSTTFTVASNPSPAGRSGAILVAGKTFVVTQLGVSCQFTVSPLSLQQAAAGGAGFLDINASNPACAWSATSNSNWISLGSPASGVGSASLAYTIAVHDGLLGRSGSITVAGSTVAVDQAGVQCALTLDEETVYAGAGGASETVPFTLNNSACPWTASSDASWLSLTSAASGVGSNSVTFSVAPYPVQGRRTAHITLNDRTITVDQFGISPPDRVPAAVFRHTSGGVVIAPYATTRFTVNSGVFGGQPAAAQDALGNTYFASLDRHGSAYGNTFLAASSAWAQLRFGGGELAGDLSMTAGSSGTAYVAGRDRWNGYWVATFTTASGFGAWTRLGGVFSTDPAIAASPDGSVYVVGRDFFGGLWSNRLAPGVGWQGWTFGGGIVNGKPSVVVGTDGVLHIAVRDYFGSVWLARVRHRRWLNWTAGGGAGVTGDPTIVAGGTGTIYVVVRTFGGSVYYRGFTEGSRSGWHDWVNTGGVLATAAAAASSGDLYIFGRDPGGFHWWFRAAASQWTNVGNRNASVTGPAAAPR